MKFSSPYVGLALALAFLSSCQQTEEVEVTTTRPVAEESATVTEGSQTEEIDLEATIASIDARRQSIEESIGEGEAMSTEGMRAKIQQKWSKIEYYTDEEGTVIRVKTYPHEGVSKRTEEFYFDGVDLVLAVIEDDGSSTRSEEGEADKMYYFHNWEVIKEVRTNGEGESGYKESDAEELLAEAREYLKIYVEK